MLSLGGLFYWQQWNLLLPLENPVQGYKYMLNWRTADGQIYWRCQDRSWPGRAVTAIGCHFSCTVFTVITANLYHFRLLDKMGHIKFLYIDKMGINCLVLPTWSNPYIHIQSYFLRTWHMTRVLFPRGFRGSKKDFHKMKGQHKWARTNTEAGRE